MSFVYPTPYYQQSHVDAYFAKVDGTPLQPYPGFNRNGRGYPDISAAGAMYVFFIGGDLVGGGGTSISCPVVAAMISLVNAARFRAGGKSVGWIHPILYGYGSTFLNDITVGDNHCTALSVCCKQGFNATKGWDPASGLGTLNFKRFKDFMMDTANLPVITDVPTLKPTANPTRKPSPSPTRKPTVAPTARPSAVPTARPTAAPTGMPSVAPASSKTVVLTSVNPTSSPSARPSMKPNAAPTSSPSDLLSESPTANSPDSEAEPSSDPDPFYANVAPTSEAVDMAQPTSYPSYHYYFVETI